MLTKKDHADRYRGIEAIRLRRVANLQRLKEQAGSWVNLSRQCGLSDSMLVHIAGPNPRRSIGEVLARDIERTMRLPAGWLDQDH